jgi:hypothetical protein
MYTTTTWNWIQRDPHSNGLIAFEWIHLHSNGSICIRMDPDSYGSAFEWIRIHFLSWISIRIRITNCIRIRIESMRIRNPAATNKINTLADGTRALQKIHRLRNILCIYVFVDN